MALAAVLLILTYTPLGITVNGNRNWLYLGSPTFRLQPAEFAKLAIIVWGADVLARKQRLLDRPKHLLVPFLPVSGLLILLVVFQGDAGTAVVMAAHRGRDACGSSVPRCRVLGRPGRRRCCRGGRDLRHLAGPDAPARRLPGPDRRTPSGTNDQANSGLFAIASGGWWGVGLGGSRQKWGSLPEAHTDFIFAVLGEEFGLFGSLVVLALFGVLGYAGIRIASPLRRPVRPVRGRRGDRLVHGPGLINLAVVLRLLPIAGVPLPLVSYGGSALIANLLAVGVLLGCARREPEARRMLARRSRAPGAADDHGGRVPRHRRRSAPMTGRPARSCWPAAGPPGTPRRWSPPPTSCAELRPDVPLTAVGTARGLETTVIPAAGLALELIPPVPMPRRPGQGPGAGRAAPGRGGADDRGRARAGWRPRRCWASAATCPPRPTWPPGGSACRSCIHEQNVLPGLANRLAARLTRHVFTSFPTDPAAARHLHRPAAAPRRSPSSTGPRWRGRRGRRSGSRRTADPAGQRRLAGRR